MLLTPYNYILNESLRKSIGLEIKGKIIIFDEAHNIEAFSE